jgi:CheY-like chemotaxis protein/HPt (histidine-containing phosphotransfer) domain-containing protein
MSQWDHSIDYVRKQLDELRQTLSQNEKLAESHRQSILDARSNVEQLLDQPPSARIALYQLPLVFGALTNTHLIGSLIMGSEGEVVMHNFTAQRFLPIDPVTGKLSACKFFDPTGSQQVPESDLPWQRCLKGHDIAPCTRLRMRHPHIEGEVHLEVGIVPLRVEQNTSGVVVLFIDSTEPVKAEQYIQSLYNSLDKQVNSIEAAHHELELLASKMGVKEWAAEEPLKQQPESKPATIPRVLLVDDIPVNQKLLVMQLRSLGVQIDQATNGMEAVMLCRKQQYSLVFMDCDMPILNGFEATEQIRKNEKTTGQHVPIVAMTSYDRAGDREKCLDSGMDDYLFKGVGRTRLQEVIDHYVFGRGEQKTTSAAEPSRQEDVSAVRLDVSKLEEKFGDDSAKILALFFGSNATLLNCLEFAIQDKDTEGVHHFAHALKGPCATLGLSYMIKLSTSLTADAEAGQWTEAGDKYRTLRDIFQRLKTQVGSLAEPQTS